jgi:hypothetical protein
VADGDHPSMNARNVANEAAFKALPMAGSLAYWARLEDAARESRLDLEVLVMCARERLTAGRRDQAERVFTLLVKKAQGTFEGWINRWTPRFALDRARLIEDIGQECATALWQEIAHSAPTFLTEGFWHKAKLMTRNVIEQRLIAEGVKTREGVERPTRAPQSQRDSLDQPAGPDTDRTLADSVADPGEDPFRLIELTTDIKALLADLSAADRLLIQNEVTEERTQVGMGKLLGRTDRWVRLRLENIRARLRAQHDQGHPPGDGGDDGGVSGGEEKRP